MSGNHSIGDVSRITGIPKDLLRMWERRYQYPNPTRDENGDRVYSDAHLDKLVLVRQLVEQGRRPGKLIPLDLPALRRLLQEGRAEIDASALVRLLSMGDANALRDWLQQQLIAYGLRAFIHNILSPAIKIVGDAWSSGDVAIYEEHFFTETVFGLVRQSLTEHYHKDGEPRVMLTTVPGEQHSLGLLMVESLLRLGGAEVVSFGAGTPFREIREAAEKLAVDVIGLSFSAAFKTEDAIVMLHGLRPMIPPDIQIWVGGEAFSDNPEMPDGVRLIDQLHGLERVLSEWKLLPGKS